MVFWMAVAVGGVFAWIAVQIGFYATWILFFHLLLSAYVAIFLTPVIIANVPAATTTDYGYALILMSVAIATLCIAYGICFACLTGHLRVEFPKIFDGIVAGLLGFQAGFLVLSFLAFTFCLTPMSKANFCKTLGFDAQSQKSNISFMCWWCDRIHGLVSCPGPQPCSKDEVALLEKTAAPATEEPGVDTGEEPAKLAAPSPPPSSSMAHKPADAEAGQAAVQAKENAATSQGEHPPERQTVAGTPEPTSPAGAQPPRQPSESLEQELARRRVVVHTPGDLEAAVAKQEVRIIEIADACTVDKLDAKQTEILQRWVSEGGILWVNNDVLTLFGVQHSRLASWGGELYCRVSGKAEVSSIMADCKKVALKDVGGKAHALASRGVMPLLALETDIPLKHTAGTTCWSLVPYGKGWISDPKSVDMTQYDGAQFWRNFCGFCLKKEPRDARGGEEALSDDKLSGVWQASTGARFLIDDDGKTVAIDLISSDAIHVLTGKLVRHDPKVDPKSLAGTFDVVFASEASTHYTIDVTMTVGDGNHLRLRCENWPKWSGQGKLIGRVALTELWTRSDSIFGKPAGNGNP
jgi:hypothetical protein